MGLWRDVEASAGIAAAGSLASTSEGSGWTSRSDLRLMVDVANDERSDDALICWRAVASKGVASPSATGKELMVRRSEKN